jgi:hypothetical protein
MTRIASTFQPLRYLHSCSGCFRLERLPGGPCTHWKAPPFHGARHFQTHALQQSRGSFEIAGQAFSSSSNALASCRTGVSKPSVNQP